MRRTGIILIALLAVCFSGAAPVRAQSRIPMEGFADLAERLTPAVVNIATSQRVSGVDDLRAPPGSPLNRFDDNGDGSAQVSSLGSGFIISADGVIVTNNHVIDAADTIQVILQSGEQYQARVVGRDPATDIAVLRVSARHPLPFVPMGDSDVARVGDLVLAIGNPFGLGGSLSVGVVSARNRNIDAGRYDDFIQTDAAINRGNSGGPLFNINGEVIGMNTAIVSPSGGSVGVSFATPTAIVKPVVEQILRWGETRRGWLGVKAANLAQTQDGAPRPGAVVTRITPGGPASAAGLRVGDVVMKFDHHDIADSRALTRMVGDATIGGHVELEVVRAGRRVVLNAAIARLAEEQTAAIDEGAPRTDGGPRGGHVFGLTLSELDASLREEYGIEPRVHGLVVRAVDDGDAGPTLQAGDVIEELAFQPVESITAARALAGRAAIGNHAVVAKVNRDGAVTYRRLLAKS